MTDTGFDIASAILILVAAVIPIYFSFKLKNLLRTIMITVSIFTLVHGSYHILEVTGYDSVAENIVEPISYAVLIVFGFVIFKLKTTRKVKVQ